MHICYNLFLYKLQGLLVIIGKLSTRIVNHLHLQMMQNVLISIKHYITRNLIEF